MKLETLPIAALVALTVSATNAAPGRKVSFVDINEEVAKVFTLCNTHKNPAACMNRMAAPLFALGCEERHSDYLCPIKAIPALRRLTPDDFPDPDAQ